MISNLKNFYVTSQTQLNEVVKLIKEVKIVALDTEFTRQTTYYPILSIVQIAVKNHQNIQELFIVDCLQNLDLSEFFALIFDEKIIKILHSSAQDLQIFCHESDALPQNIFDTQIMANFCGFGFSVGYSRLVEILFEKNLDKKQQRSDWQLRPLTSQQIEYALFDVIFLQDIYQKFSEILQQNNRQDWHWQETQNFLNKILDKSDAALSKKFSFRSKSPKQIWQIQNLISCRERWARKINVPRQHLIKDEVIENLVLGLVKKLDLAPEINAEIEKILAQKEQSFDKNSPQNSDFLMNQKQKNCFEEAKKLIKTIALQENFQEQFLINSNELKELICQPQFFAQKLVGWREKLFGQQLKNLIYTQ